MGRAKEVHGNKYDYQMINSGHIQNKYSYVPLKCNQCIYQWSPSIHARIHGKKLVVLIVLAIVNGV